MTDIKKILKEDALQDEEVNEENLQAYREGYGTGLVNTKISDRENEVIAWRYFSTV